jgi:hypothetical protein
MPTANQARKTAPSPFQLVAGHPVLDFVNTLDGADPMPGKNERQGRRANIFFFTRVHCSGAIGFGDTQRDTIYR